MMDAKSITNSKRHPFERIRLVSSMKTIITPGNISFVELLSDTKGYILDILAGVRVSRSFSDGC
jgi:hypothetical protein